MMTAGVKVRRGDVVTVVLGVSRMRRAFLPGGFGKPRPALVIQSDFFEEHSSVTILPISWEFRRTPFFRVAVKPSSENGLRKPSQVMVDKSRSVPREMIRAAVGRLEPDAMLSVTRALALFLGFA